MVSPCSERGELQVKHERLFWVGALCEFGDDELEPAELEKGVRIAMASYLLVRGTY